MSDEEIREMVGGLIEGSTGLWDPWSEADRDAALEWLQRVWISYLVMGKLLKPGQLENILAEQIDEDLPEPIRS